MKISKITIEIIKRSNCISEICVTAQNESNNDPAEKDISSKMLVKTEKDGVIDLYDVIVLIRLLAK